MKTLISLLILASFGLLAGCVAVPTRHGLVVAPLVPTVDVGVGYAYGPYYHHYR